MGSQTDVDVDADLQQYRTTIVARLDNIHQMLVSIEEVAERRHAEIMAILLSRTKLKQSVPPPVVTTVAQPSSAVIPPARVSTTRVLGSGDEGGFSYAGEDSGPLGEKGEERGVRKEVLETEWVKKSLRKNLKGLGFGNNIANGGAVDTKKADEPLVIIESDYDVFTGVGLVSTQLHKAVDGSFGRRGEPIYGLQLRNLQIKTWDPGINIKTSKQHLEDKVFLGSGVVIRI